MLVRYYHIANQNILLPYFLYEPVIAFSGETDSWIFCLVLTN